MLLLSFDSPLTLPSVGQFDILFRKWEIENYVDNFYSVVKIPLNGASKAL